MTTPTDPVAVALVASLTAALSRGITVPPIPANMHGTPSYQQLWSECQAEVHVECFRAVRTALDNLPEMTRYDTQFFRFDGMGVQRDDVVRWLLAQTSKAGDAQKVVEKFLAFLCTNQADALFVVAINGPSVQQEIELIEGLRLIPIDALPPSLMKDSVAPPFSAWTLHSYRERATCALVTRGRIDRVFRAGGESSDRIDIAPEFNFLRAVHLALTLEGPRASIPMSGWVQIIDEGVPTTLSASSTTYGDARSINPLFAMKVAPFDAAHARQIVHDFLQLNSTSPKDFASLFVPLIRLNEAIRQSDPVERAIDLGIALEALLLTDTDARELSYRLRYRGAWLMGKDVADRERVFKLLGHIYELRSAAVHGGSFSERLLARLPTSQDPLLRSPNHVLWDGILLCAGVITWIIEHGGFPNWDRLTLGGQPTR